MDEFTGKAAPVIMVHTNNQLAEAAEKIATSGVISLDTEYDSFKRQYGFNMLLVQVYDLHAVYLIDPLTVSDFNPLWRVLEDPGVEKILYSGSEDIALIKQNGCQIRNVFDVQVAATLANHPARNLGDLLLAETGLTIDKSEQTSDWSSRPLSEAKIEYAMNDVLFLPEIRNRLMKIIAERGLVHVLQQENSAMEAINERTHIPKIKPSYYREFSKSYCDSLLALLQCRDEIGRVNNIPPNRIVDTRFLEEALQKRDAFIRSGEFRSFHPRVRHNERYKQQFIAILKSYDPASTEKYPRPDRRRKRVYSKEEQLKIVEQFYTPRKEAYVIQYGERTAEFLLRGLKKRLISGDTESDDLLPYQVEIFSELVKSIQL
jgi:ribonuclease D